MQIPTARRGGRRDFQFPALVCGNDRSWLRLAPQNRPIRCRNARKDNVNLRPQKMPNGARPPAPPLTHNPSHHQVVGSTPSNHHFLTPPPPITPHCTKISNLPSAMGYRRAHQEVSYSAAIRYRPL